MRVHISNMHVYLLTCSDPPVWLNADTIRYRYFTEYIVDTDTDTDSGMKNLSATKKTVK